MTVTYMQLSEFVKAAGVYLGMDPRQPRPVPADGKFAYAVRKLHKAATAAFTAYSNELDDLKVMHAIEKDGKLLKADNGAYEYTKDEQLAMNKAVRDLNAKAIEFAPFFVAAEHVPADLPADFRLAFEGWVIEAEGELVYDIMTDTKKLRRVVNE